MAELNPHSPRRLDGPMRRVVRPANVPPRAYPVTPQAAETKTESQVPPEPTPGPVAHAPKSSFKFERPGVKKPHPWRKRVVLFFIALFVLAGVGMGITAVMASQKIITRNSTGGAPALAGNIDPTKLRGEGDGRINILLLGIGGPGHDGSYLSDTIMVASIDPKTKDVAMLSIPRDMYVPIPGYGSTKINAASAYGETKQHPGGGAELAKATVSKVLDIPIHYYVRVDFTAFKQAVDAVGGIDVNVDQSLYDPEYPCDYDQGLSCGFRLSAGPHHMDGALALEYARCRKGNCGNDYGRAARQQKVLLALRQKALDVSTLTNPVKVLALVSAAGSHINTDLQPNEIKKLATIVKDINTSTVVQKVLDASPSGLLTETSIDGSGSVQIPKAGIGNFSEIRAFVHQLFVDNYLKGENAQIEVQNGTLRSGLATAVGNLLKGYGYNVVSMVTAAEQNHSVTAIYDYTGGKKPYTIRYLENRFGVKAQKAAPAPADPNAPAPDIRIIVGNDYKVSQSQ